MNGDSRPARIGVLLIALGAAVALSLMLSCAPEGRRHLDTQDRTGRLVAPPLLRIALHKGPGPLEIACAKHCILIADGLTNGFRALENLPATQVSAVEGRLMLGREPVSSSELTVTPLNAAFIQLNSVLYPGSIRILAAEGDSLLVLNIVDTETYLAGVIPAEMPSRWPLEALKAQTVAARTYALQRKKERADALYDLEATTMDQVYSGWQQPDANVQDAIRETRGLVLLHGGKLFTAYFSSTCGGRTLDAAGLMPAPDAAFIKGVPCEFCRRSPRYAWSFEISNADLAAKLKETGYDFGGAFRITVQRASEFATAEHIFIEANGTTSELPLDDFMRACGRQYFYSRRFGVTQSASGVVVEGRGFGHGVGLCQYGAKGMADEGWEYDSILGWYYGDVALAQIY